MTCTILLVEDVEDNRELARLLLEGDGYAVLEAHNGAEAVSLALAHRPQLILMDLSLPVMDGWEAMRQLRDRPEMAGVPIVALTAHAMQGDRERALNAGFDGYIPKPIEVSTFSGELATYLNR